MKIFKAIFSRDGDEPAKRIDSPMDLAKGDMFTLTDSFALPEQLRGRQFRVASVATYQFEHEHYRELALDSEESFPMYLSLYGDEISFSVEVRREVVESLFDMDEFAGLFDPDAPGAMQGPDPASTPDDMSGWVGDAYQRSVCGLRGYWHERDYGRGRPPSTTGSGEPFDRYEAVTTDESRAIEIEVWETGETDVYLVLNRPATDIVDCFPGS